MGIKITGSTAWIKTAQKGNYYQLGKALAGQLGKD
jgi:hypothetical protein